MGRRGDLYAWSYQYIVPDGNLVAIYQHATKVDGYIVSDVDVVPETADEFIAYGYIVAHGSELLLQHGISGAPLAIRGRVVSGTPLGCLGFPLDEDGVVTIVPFARHTLFQFRFHRVVELRFMTLCMQI